MHYLIAKDNASEFHLTPTPPPSSTVKSIQNGLLSSPFKPKSEELKSPTSNGRSFVLTYIIFNSNLYSLALPNKPTPSFPCLSPSVAGNSTRWIPKLSLKLAMKDHPLSFRAAKRAKLSNSNAKTEDINMEVELKTHEIIVRGDDPKVLLEDSFEIQGDVPRGFFVMIAKKNIPYNFVFAYPEHPWFEDVCGLRKSAYFLMRTAEGESYELHLKPTRDKQ